VTTTLPSSFELQRHWKLVALLQRVLKVHHHEVISAWHEHDRLAGTDGEAMQRIFLRFNRTTWVAPAARCSASVNGKARRKEYPSAAQDV
jgi:hypothetical protein